MPMPVGEETVSTTITCDYQVTRQKGSTMRPSSSMRWNITNELKINRYIKDFGKMYSLRTQVIAGHLWMM